MGGASQSHACVSPLRSVLRCNGGCTSADQLQQVVGRLHSALLATVVPAFAGFLSCNRTDAWWHSFQVA